MIISGTIRRVAGFTLVEMLIVIAIIALLAALLLPALRRSLESARQLTCTNQLAQLGVATTVYLGEAHNFFPYGSTSAGKGWCDRTEPLATISGYDGMADKDYYRWNAATLFNCPSSDLREPPTGFWCDFAANKGIFRPHTWAPNRRMSEVSPAGDKVLMFDAKSMAKPADGGYGTLNTGWEFTVSWPQNIWTGRHLGGFNVLWADCHVSSRSMGDLDDKKNFRTANE